MHLTSGLAIFILAVILMLGWFAIGTQWNVRKGDSVLKWLQDGLPVIGERTTMRWLGSSVLELKIEKASKPFKSAEAVIVFEPRDVAFLWGLARLRGRRDLFIFRSQLRSEPQFEIEAIEPGAWSTSGIEKSVKKNHWRHLEAAAGTFPGQLSIYCPNGDNAAKALDFVGRASRTGKKLIRLSIRRDKQTLELQYPLSQANTISAKELFSGIKQLAGSLIETSE